MQVFDENSVSKIKFYGRKEIKLAFEVGVVAACKTVTL